jgi:hypothetical protein
MIGSVALAQDATPPAPDATPPAADAVPPAADAAAPATTTPDANYPPCSAKVQDHCTQGAHGGSAHKAAKKSHHKSK